MTQRNKKTAENKAAAVNKCKLAWTANGWDDYLHWQKTDRDILDEINRLVEEICLDPFNGTGKPEPLKGDLTGFWSRRITKVDRLVYIVDKGVFTVIACRHHN